MSTPCAGCPFAGCAGCAWQWPVVITNEGVDLECSSDPRECVNTPGARPEPSEEVRHDEYTQRACR